MVFINPSGATPSDMGSSNPSPPLDRHQAEQWFDQLSEDTRENLPEYFDGNDSELAASRFPDILCVKATAIQGTDGRYLHANRVQLGTSSFVVAQHPKKDSHELFLQTWFRHEGPLLDLTNEIDRFSHQCGRYCPEEEGKTLEKGNLTITLEKVETWNTDLTAYRYRFKDSDSGEEKVKVRLRYTGWPDHGRVDGEELLRLSLCMDKYGEQGGFIHCRAGVGRSGTLAVVRALLKEKETLTRENAGQRIHTLILEGRKARGEHFVQRPVQLQSIIDAANLILEGKIPELPTPISTAAPLPASAQPDALASIRSDTEHFVDSKETAIKAYPNLRPGEYRVWQSASDKSKAAVVCRPIASKHNSPREFFKNITLITIRPESLGLLIQDAANQKGDLKTLLDLRAHNRLAFDENEAREKLEDMEEGDYVVFYQPTEFLLLSNWHILRKPKGGEVSRSTSSSAASLSDQEGLIFEEEEEPIDPNRINLPVFEKGGFQKAIEAGLRAITPTFGSPDS